MEKTVEEKDGGKKGDKDGDWGIFIPIFWNHPVGGFTRRLGLDAGGQQVPGTILAPKMSSSLVLCMSCMQTWGRRHVSSVYGQFTAKQPRGTLTFPAARTPQTPLISRRDVVSNDGEARFW